MVALAVLFAKGVFEHYFVMNSWGMDAALIESVLSGQEQDVMGLSWTYDGMIASWWGGVVLLWVAATLTLITGMDYFNKALPHLKEPG